MMLGNAIILTLFVLALALSRSAALISVFTSRSGVAPRRSLCRSTRGMVPQQYIIKSTITTPKLQMASGDIAEFGDDDDDENEEESNLQAALDNDSTDQEKGITHGYEKNFKVGDTVRVKTQVRIYSVKPFLEKGINPVDMEGEVKELVLYGRKHKSLCSAITPIKVQFKPGGKGVPVEVERPFFLHFAAGEVELIPHTG